MNEIFNYDKLFILQNLGLEKTKQIESSLKLQKLLREEIDTLKYEIKTFVPEWEVSTYTIPILEGKLRTLEQLVEESEK